MPRAKTVKEYFSLEKGYITESSNLTYPPNSARDISNIDINLDGSFNCRLGIDYEQGFTLSDDSFAQSDVESFGLSVGEWKEPGANPALTFNVVQIGSILYFHDASSIYAVSSQVKNFTVNLANYIQPNESNAGRLPIQVESALGYLFVFSNQINPFYITYNENTDSITVTSINITIRDTIGLDDGLAVNTRPTTSLAANPKHAYNLINQGWDQTKINAFFASQMMYPSNADQWFLGKDINENFSPTTLVKIDIGTTRAPRGRLLLNAFYKDRTAALVAAGVNSYILPPEIITTRPSTGVFYNGRILYAGNQPGIIYHSQVYTSILSFGICYQEADPTSEKINDLVDSDGFVLQIPECGAIYKLVVVDDGVAIMASNGVWKLSGVGGALTATNQQVFKVTEIAALSASSITVMEGRIIYVSDGGIYALMPDSVSSKLIPTSLTLNTIQTFFNNITLAARRNSILKYNPFEKYFVWLVNASSNYNGIIKRFQYDTIVFFNLKLNAFYKYSLDTSAIHPYITGVVIPPTQALEQNISNVTLDDVPVTVNGIPVTVINYRPTSNIFSRPYFLTLNLDGDIYRYTFSSFYNQSFVDWFSDNQIGVSYSCYVETGHELAGNAFISKQNQYVYCFFERTETNFVPDQNGNAIYDFPSSCLMTFKWDFADNIASGKWSSPQQVYRFRHNYIPGTDSEPFTNGLPVVVTKTKFRGEGKALSIRFENVAGNNFHLLAWSLPITTTTNV